VIAALFAQSRSLFVIGFAGWLGLCVYAGGLLDGNRAYSAVLSGYTVALVAMTQIDSPQNIFWAGINRGAAIVVGIVAVTLISELFAAPNLHPGLSGKLTAAHQRVRVASQGFALTADHPQHCLITFGSGRRVKPTFRAGPRREITNSPCFRQH
jgi:uncharacterized membrane protein YccC